MNNPFSSDSTWYPFRWFLVILAALTMSMSYADFTGWRFLGPSNTAQHSGYYGSHYYHK